MPLSWNEIKLRTITFSTEWKDETKEHSEAKSFWDGFFNVFGIGRRRLASFEEPVKKLGNRQGFIDLFWKGNLIVEHKSKGNDLDKAYQQDIDYFPGLKEEELPKYILVSDFERFRLYDLEEDIQHNFLITELHANIKLFGFIAGYNKTKFREEHPINIKAAEKIGKLHDRLKEIGYEGHELEVYLVRILFILFADDTGIFEKDIFWDFVENHTSEDGSDLASKLSELFQTLNTSPEKRFKHQNEIFTQFPYINGNLFDENLPIAAFDKGMRQILLENCSIDWGLISPAIFGSLFQSIMDKTERRNLGAHYTSEKNIMKLIKPLFLDELWDKFHKIKGNSKQLAEFHKTIGELKFLDPACGSGDFLIIAYRELRLLELEILRTIYKIEKVFLIENIIWVDIDQFYGIEIDEWAARIAEVAMWLIDHQMNMVISNEFGSYFARIPLKKSANIVHGNSLRIDWQSLLNPVNTIDIVAKHTNIYLVSEPQAEYKTVNVKTEGYQIHQGEPLQFKNEIKFDFILGNPPFLGSRIMDKIQKEDLTAVFEDAKKVGELDYVSGWYIKAAQYIQNTKIKVAFVSTNSIVQGLQTGILWNNLLNKYHIKIHFAHRAFRWNNEAKGQAAVHVVIIGYANFDIQNKLLYDYENTKSEAHEIKVSNINPYLVEAKNILIQSRTKPLCQVPEMNFGNMPADGGEFLFTTAEKIEFLRKEPNAELYFKPFISAHEFINNKQRWCLWLKDNEPNELRKMKNVLERVQNVQTIREKSSRPQLASIPHLFAQITQPENLNYILIPRHSSENRKFIPIGFFDAENIAADSCLIIPNGTLFHFGILTSLMHMTWVKYTCGRLEISFRYSKDIVYNNYPFPKEINDKQKERVENAAQLVLDTRLKYPNSSLADLYDPLSMPLDLVKAHNELDKAVDLCYRSQPFVNERARIEFLFDLYSQYVAPLQAQLDKHEKKEKRKKK